MTPLDVIPYHCLPLSALPEPLDPSPDPEALALTAERQQHIKALFYRLFTSRDASILCDLYFEDMSQEHVATLQGLSVKRIEAIRTNAFKILRKSAEFYSLLIPTATR